MNSTNFLKQSRTGHTRCFTRWLILANVIAVAFSACSGSGPKCRFKDTGMHRHEHTDCVYDGMMRNGKRQGHGTMRWKNGSVYVGEWLGDHRHGTGRYTSADVSPMLDYEGEWAHDKFQGHGTMRWKIGHVYEGQWLDHHQHGTGIFTWQNQADGSVYVGGFSNSKMHGNGVYYWSKDGRVYDQEYERNKRTRHTPIKDETWSKAFTDLARDNHTFNSRVVELEKTLAESQKLDTKSIDQTRAADLKTKLRNTKNKLHDNGKALMAMMEIFFGDETAKRKTIGDILKENLRLSEELRKSEETIIRLRVKLGIKDANEEVAKFCIVCQDRKRTHVCMPCRHYILCDGKGEIECHTLPRNECPTCSTLVEEIVPIESVADSVQIFES